MILFLNHAMLVDDTKAERVAFYILIAGLPVGIALAYRAIRRAYTREFENETMESLVSIGVGLSFIGVVWVISQIFY